MVDFDNRYKIFCKAFVFHKASVFLLCKFLEREGSKVKVGNYILNSEQGCINLISGAYTLPLIDKLYMQNKEEETVDDIYYSLVSLYNADNIPEASKVIRGLFDMAKMTYPYIIVFLDADKTLQEIFVREFLADFKEIIGEREIED